MINHGNQCYLNSILWPLINFEFPKQNQFSEYLVQTLEYMKQEKESCNVILFILELQKRNPILFSHEPQDAFEALLWILKEANIEALIFYKEMPIVPFSQIWISWKQSYLDYKCPALDEGQQMLRVRLQYIDNDQIIDILPLKYLQIEGIVSLKELKDIIRNAIDVDIDFDIIQEGLVVQSEYIEVGDEIQVLFRTKDQQEFDTCRFWNTPSYIEGYPRQQIHFDEELTNSSMLVIHMDRIHQVKNHNVYVPPEIVTVGKKCYGIQAITCHLGGEVGHYVTYLSNPWRRIDDQSVIFQEPSYECYSSCYLLFYKELN